MSSYLHKCAFLICSTSSNVQYRFAHLCKSRTDLFCARTFGLRQLSLDYLHQHPYQPHRAHPPPPTPLGCSLPQHTMLLGELHCDAEVLVARAVSAAAISSCPHKKRKRGSRRGCPLRVHHRRSVSHIYQRLGETYFRCAYRMSYPSFVELHEHVQTH